ncbi:MAG: hypothetical protein AAGJ73_15875 [Pseudomonadota bacterium]
MATTDYQLDGRTRSGGGVWFAFVLVVILLAGGVLSFLAYQQNDLSMVEAIAAGFAGVGALFIGLITAAVGLVLGLIGAVIGIIATGGALALTAFLVGSPIIAIILFVLLMRRDKGCPDPSAHGDF